jgi:hypothetical protein
MNTKEYVKLVADGNYIPVKYAVMEATVGANAAGTYLWLKASGYGFDTDVHYNAYLASIESNSGDVPPVTTGIQGTMDAYSIVALSAVAAYKSPKNHHTGPYMIG